MKKYITIAALFAAGTAFANAGTPQILTWTGSNGTFTVDEAKQESNWNGVTPTLDSGQVYGIYTFSTGGSITIGSSGDLWGGMYTSDGGSWTGTDGTFSTNSRMYTQGKTIVFSGNVDLGAGASYVLKTRVLFDGVGRINGDGTQVASISALFNDLITADFEGLDKYDVSLSTAALTAEDMGKYFLSTDGTNIVLNYVSAVPEPSAFGLLAGLGALVAVSSRRRRR